MRAAVRTPTYHRWLNGSSLGTPQNTRRESGSNHYTFKRVNRYLIKATSMHSCHRNAIPNHQLAYVHNCIVHNPTHVDRRQVAGPPTDLQRGTTCHRVGVIHLTRWPVPSEQRVGEVRLPSAAPPVPSPLRMQRPCVDSSGAARARAAGISQAGNTGSSVASESGIDMAADGA